MHIRRVLPALATVILLSASVLASDVSGKWKGPMQSGGEAVLTLKSDKATVTGTMLGADGKEYPATGKLDGDNISLTVASQWQGQPVTLIVSGKVSGEEMQIHIASDNGYWSTDAALKREK